PLSSVVPALGGAEISVEISQNGPNSYLIRDLRVSISNSPGLYFTIRSVFPVLRGNFNSNLSQFSDVNEVVAPNGKRLTSAEVITAIPAPPLTTETISLWIGSLELAPGCRNQAVFDANVEPKYQSSCR